MSVIPRSRCTAAVLGLLLGGCGLLGGRDPGGRTAEGGKAGTSITVDEIDQITKSFADRYVNLLTNACDEIKRASANHEQRRNAHRLKLLSTTNVYDAVTGPDPVKQLVDLAVIVTLDKLVWVDEGQAERFFGAARSDALEQALESAQDELWRLCLRAMRPEQLDALKEAVRQWRRDNPDLTWVSGVRFDVVAGPKGGAGSEGILGTLSAVGGSIPDSVGQARLAAQRAFYYLKRFPTLFDWHVEEALKNATSTPEVESMGRVLSEALASASRVLSQVATLMEPSRPGEDVTLPPRLREIRDLLTEGGDLAGEVRKAADAAAELMKGVEKTGSLNSFEIREYTAAGARLAEAAREATVLVRELRRFLDSPEASNRVEQSLESATKQVRREGRSLIDYASWRGAQLIVLAVLVLTGSAVLLFWIRSHIRSRATPGT